MLSWRGAANRLVLVGIYRAPGQGSFGRVLDTVENATKLQGVMTSVTPRAASLDANVRATWVHLRSVVACIWGGGVSRSIVQPGKYAPHSRTTKGSPGP